MRLMPEAMDRLFQPTLTKIKAAIGEVLNNPDVKGKIPWHTHPQPAHSCYPIFVITLIIFLSANMITGTCTNSKVASWTL